MLNKSKLNVPWRDITNNNSGDRFAIFHEKKNDICVKKMLCRNMTMFGTCEYGTKCKFAHNLNEQIIDDYRKESYGILLSKKKLDNYDMQKNYTLYRSLLNLTKICEQCEKGKCTGGYNCKYGVCSKKYQICERDLNYGNCFNNCEFVHLTKRGLKPFYRTMTEIQCQPLNGTLLSTDFFKKIIEKNESNNDSESIISIESNNNQFDDFNDFDKSIFEKN